LKRADHAQIVPRRVFPGKYRRLIRRFENKRGAAYLRTQSAVRGANYYCSVAASAWSGRLARASVFASSERGLIETAAAEDAIRFHVAPPHSTPRILDCPRRGYVCLDRS